MFSLAAVPSEVLSKWRNVGEPALEYDVETDRESAERYERERKEAHERAERERKKERELADLRLREAREQHDRGGEER